MKIIDLNEIAYINYKDTDQNRIKIIVCLKGTDDPWYFYDHEAKDLWKKFNAYKNHPDRMFTTIGE